MGWNWENAPWALCIFGQRCPCWLGCQGRRSLPQAEVVLSPFAWYGTSLKFWKCGKCELFGKFIQRVRFWLHTCTCPVSKPDAGELATPTPPITCTVTKRERTSKQAEWPLAITANSSCLPFLNWMIRCMFTEPPKDCSRIFFFVLFFCRGENVFE